MGDGSAFLEALEHEMRGALEDSWFALLRWVHGTHYGDSPRDAEWRAEAKARAGRGELPPWPSYDD